MRSYEGIARNFSLLLAQVRKQIENTGRLLRAPAPALIKSIRGSEDYIDTQRGMIENDCFELIRRAKQEDEGTHDSVRALNVIASNLERIADFAVNITRQFERLSTPQRLTLINAQRQVETLLKGVDLIEPALFNRDATQALEICRTEDEIDHLYAEDSERIVAAMNQSRDVADLVTVLFITHYLERMGDALLNVGEAIIFAVLGERLKIHQYKVLEDALAAVSGKEQPLERVDLESIWGTRSGVRVGRTGHDAAALDRRVLFKEGNPDKLQRERSALERWEKIAPGLVPAVMEYRDGRQGAALLLQYLDGATLQDTVLNADLGAIDAALDRLEATLSHLWTVTRTAEHAHAQHVTQLRQRLEDVRRLHPRLFGQSVRMGNLKVPSFEELLEEVAPLEAVLPAPFTVFIHGDFNLDNIIYNPATNKLHFIDVYRSREQDYVQDVSVFLISAFRMPVFAGDVRRKLEHVAQRVLSFARRFAAENGDALFEPRLALGLARSFVTSTRFELNRRFARAMVQRSRLLLQKLYDFHQQHPDSWQGFVVPDNALIY